MKDFWPLLLLFTIPGWLCACGPEVSDPLPDWPVLDDILLEPETIEQSYDGSEREMGESALRVHEQLLVGDEPILLGHLRQGLQISNAMTRKGLTFMREIALTEEPTTAGKDRFVWEVERGDNDLTLIVERPAGGLRWNYNLLLHPRGDDGVPRLLLGGWFRPDGREDGRQMGSGFIRYDYDAFASLPDQDEPVQGIGSFAFRTAPRGELTMRVVFDGFGSRLAQNRLHAQYKYTLRAGGGGEFQYLLDTDLFPNIEGDELAGEIVVWLPNRAAKGRMLARNPEIEDSPERRINECWGTNRRQLWVQFDPERPGESDGNEADCVGRLADLELEEPDLNPIEPGFLPEVP